MPKFQVIRNTTTGMQEIDVGDAELESITVEGFIGLCSRKFGITGTFELKLDTRILPQSQKLKDVNYSNSNEKAFRLTKKSVGGRNL